MKILIACEESQRICIEFRKNGHEAFSADLQDCSGGHPEWHYKGDVLKLINGFCSFKTENGEEVKINSKWDLIIAHPPCTYLSNAGARWLYARGALNEERYKLGLNGKSFFEEFLKANCDHIAIENPTPNKIFNLPKCTQIIQPYMFGEPWSKRTCLWLKGLPDLKATEIVEEYKPFCSSGSYKKTHDKKYSGSSRKGGASKARSKTFKGIAKAMAEQWSEL